MISHLELTSMLDSLGSTLTRSTVNSFFTRHGKKPHEDDLTVAEAIQCLETELGRPDSEKKRLDADDSLPDTSVSATPIMMAADGKGQELALDQLDFSGPPLHGGVGHSETGQQASKPAAPAGHPTEPAEQSLAQAAMGGGSVAVATTPGLEERENPYGSSDDAEESSGSVVDPSMNKKKLRFRKGKGKKQTKQNSGSSSGSGSSEDSFERVINVKNCPLCHRPRLNSKAEMDIVTHLAVCASQDWNKVDRIVVGNFVTASQAQRKWYTKIISKVSSGDYKLGAASPMFHIVELSIDICV